MYGRQVMEGVMMIVAIAMDILQVLSQFLLEVLQKGENFLGMGKDVPVL